MDNLTNSTQPAVATESNSIVSDMEKAFDKVETNPIEEKSLSTEASPQSKEVTTDVIGKKPELGTEATKPTEQTPVLDDVVKLKDTIKEYETSFAVIEPYIKNSGFSRSEYIKNIADIERDLSTDPLRGIAILAQRFGIDVRTAYGQQAQPVQQPQHKQNNDDAYIDPSVNAALKPVLDKVGAVERQFQEMQQRTRQAQVDSDIKDFSEKNPHFAKIQADKELRDEMSVIVYGFKSAYPNLSNKEILQKAYDKVVWSNPEVREILQNDAKAKQVEQSNAKAAAAKKAGASVSGSPSGKVSSQMQSDRPIDEIMSAVWDKSSTGRL